MDHPGGPQIQSQVSFIKWRQRAIDHRRGESSVRIEVDVGGVCGGRGGGLRGKQCCSYKKLEEAKDEFFPRPSGRSTALPAPCVNLL